MGIFSSALSSVRKTFTDTFNRADQSGIGVASDGTQWDILNGSFSISSNKLAASSGSSYPLAVVDFPDTDVSIDLKGIGQGASASLWVTDSGNWWAVGIDQQIETCNCQTCNDCIQTTGGNCIINYAGGNCASFTTVDASCISYNNSGGNCSGFNNSGGTCSAFNNSGGTCSAFNNSGGSCSTYSNGGGTCRAWNSVTSSCVFWNSITCSAYNSGTCRAFVTTNICSAYNTRTCRAYSGGTCSTYSNAGGSCSGLYNTVTSACNGYNTVNSACAGTAYNTVNSFCTGTAYNTVNSFCTGTSYNTINSFCSSSNSPYDYCNGTAYNTINSFCTGAYNTIDCVAWNSYSCNCQTCYPQYVRILKSVNSTVSEVTSWLVNSVVGSLRVKTSGSQITTQVFSDSDNVTQIGSDLVYTPTGVSFTPRFGITIKPTAANQDLTIDQINISRN